MVRGTSVKQRCVRSRMNEHGTGNTEPMIKHLSEWQMFKETCDLYVLPPVYNKEDQNGILMMSHILSGVVKNLEIIDFDYNRLQILFLEA